MIINYLDFLVYAIICILAWFLTSEESNEEIRIFFFIRFCIIFTIIWIIIFVYPIDLNISQIPNVVSNWDIKLKP
jgi:cell division protein FtsW (lipid II flippase)